MSDAVIKYRFPPTSPLEACYSAIVPDKTRQFSSVRELDKVLTRREEADQNGGGSCGLPISLPLPLVGREETLSLGEDSHIRQLPWSERLQSLHEKLTNEIAALQRNQYIQERHLKQVLPGVRSLLNASRDSPEQTADILCAHSMIGYVPQCYVRRCVVRCAGDGCNGKSLPFSRFCIRHMNCDGDQVLYRSCQAIDCNSLTQCMQPVHDLLLEAPLCGRHMGTVEGNQVILKRKAAAKLKTKTASPAQKTASPAQKTKKTPPNRAKTTATSALKQSAKGQQAPKRKLDALPTSSPLPVAPPISSSSPLPVPVTVVPRLSSSSWSSGTDSDGDASATKQPRVCTNTEQAGETETSSTNPLPTLPSDDLIFSPPLPTLPLDLPLSLAELGNIMEDSDEEFL